MTGETVISYAADDARDRGAASPTDSVLFYAADAARYLRWRQARQTRYWAIDRHWYQLLGWLGEDCVAHRFDVMSPYPFSMLRDGYGRFDRMLILRQCDMLHAPSSPAAVAYVAMELFRARWPARIPS